MPRKPKHTIAEIEDALADFLTVCRQTQMAVKIKTRAIVERILSNAIRQRKACAGNPGRPPVEFEEQFYVWRVKTRLPERKGTLCRVAVRGKLNNCLVEFVSDGYRVVTSRNYVRKVKQGGAA